MFIPVSLKGGTRRLLLAAVFLLAGKAFLAAQTEILHEERYLQPSAEIAALIAAPRHEAVLLTNLSPARDLFLNSESEGLPSLAAFAKPYYRLAGLALDPAASRSRTLTTRGSAGLELIDWRSGRRTPIQVPADATVTGARWSPDGSHVAFLVNRPSETHIYVAQTSDARSRQLTRSPLLATRVTSLEWSGDGRYIYAVVLPEGRGPEPARPASPTTPIVRVAAPAENTLRTYPSLLKDPYDQALFEHYSTGQLVRIEVSNRRVQPIGSQAMIESIDVSPTGEYVRVRTTRKPFSYIVPVSQFADLEEVWDLEGNALVELEKRDAREGIEVPPEEREESPRRALTWRPDGQGLSFLRREPEPEGEEPAEPGEEAERRDRNASRKDRVMQWVPPFEEDSQRVIYESPTEIRSVEYSPDVRWLFLTERNRNTDHLFAVHLDDPETRYTIYEWDTEDFYANPGSLLTTENDRGVSVVRLSPDGESVYLSGTRYFEDPEEDAPRAFIDRVEIRSGEKERIWEASGDVTERVTAILDDDLNELVLARESPAMVPNSWHLDRRTGALRQLTGNADPHPGITAMRRERLTVTRADGLRFKANVTFPAGYEEGTRLPAMFWFYPREYTDQEAYDRTWRTHNKNRFVTAGPRSMEILAAAGYLVVQPDHPIVGPQNRMNDRYVHDLRQNHLAVIDALDERGWLDRRRVALGGHSYGGFGTINALVHTPYFRAGIAGAPNSNRLLTPIGFQSERRALWEARETYLEMSPFLWAERMLGALLIYHGEDDQNTGTFPDNSWRLIHALNGLGKTAALYMYPYEDHGPAAAETLMDMWARWIAWLDHYVKEADAREAGAREANAPDPPGNQDP